MTGALLRVGILTFIAILLPLFPWPDIPAGVLNAIGTFLAYLFSFNAMLPVSEMMIIFLLVVGIDLFMFGLRLGGRVTGFLAGNKTPVDDIGK